MAMEIVIGKFPNTDNKVEFNLQQGPAMKTKPIHSLAIAISILVLSGVGLCAQAAETITLEAVKDTTIYSEGELSNGQGAYLFAGETNRGSLRRALVGFDVSTLPDGALVQNASLTLQMNKSNAGAEPVALHRMIGDWGEGASDASANEGSGTAATDGDATWTVRFSPDFPWLSDGGDFIEAPSATIQVDGPGSYSWTGPGVVADVQAWIDDPTLVTSWILIGNESVLSAKRFDSRHATEASVRPTLSITYIIREEVQNWAGYPVEGDGVSVNTEGFLGWIDVSQAPWIYSYSLGKFLYLPEDNVSSAGGWAYAPAQ
jgi:hypothetical protein